MPMSVAVCIKVFYLICKCYMVILLKGFPEVIINYCGKSAIQEFFIGHINKFV